MQLPPDLIEDARAFVDGGAFALPVSHPLTLGDALLRTAREAPDHGIYYLDASTERRQTYPELLADASRILSGLRSGGLAPGARVLFQCDRNEDFIPAFWACVLGGFVPVPVPIAPTYEEANGALAKLLNAWSMLGEPVTLAGSAIGRQLRAYVRREGIDRCRVLDIAELRAHPVAQSFHASDPDDTALLLLTSGSTGTPKAVRQTHRGLVSWAVSFGAACAITAADRTLNWMPLDHVGGIVFFVIRETVLGGTQFHAPTAAALERPLLWLDWIERHRITVTWAPNFVYALVNGCADEIAARRWDLSSLHCVLNGGEAVVSRTARRFLSLLLPHGLPRTAMFPVWGMSETSSGCIFSRRFTLETTDDADPFVAVGVPIPGLQVRIADEQDRILPEGRIGRMQIRGISITPGYENNTDATAHAFSADGWFITGDLAVIRDRQLAIVGREKDVIIINGVNYYSHEIEALAEEVEGVSVSFTAACAVRGAGDDSDRLALFFSPAPEAFGDLPELLRRLRMTVARDAGVMPDYVVPVAQEDIPKTSLGKIQRSQLKDRFEQGEFASVLARQHRPAAVTALFETVWRPAPAAGEGADRWGLPPGSRVLVFADETPLGTGVVAALRQAGFATVAVRPGTAFAADTSADLRLDPAASYAALFRHLDEAGAVPTHVVHAWSYPAARPGAWEAVQARGSLSLLRLVQALPAPAAGEAVRLLVVTSGVQADDAGADPGKAAVLGILNTIPHEYEWLEAGTLDFTAPEPEADVASVLREIAAPAREARIAGGERAVPLLRPAVPDGSPLIRGGFYVLSGAQGGIAAMLARHLRDRFGATLLMLARSAPVPAPGDAAEGVAWAVGDIADARFVAEAISRAASQWGRAPDGVFHLAGLYHEAALKAETDAAILAMLRPKLRGAAALLEAIAPYPECRFVAFSTLIARFGAMATGAYAIANAGLDALARQARARGRPAQTVLWSPWMGVGMGRRADPDAARARGFLPLSPEAGLALLEQALGCSAATVLAGLDAGSSALRPALDPAFVPSGAEDARPVAPRSDTERRLARCWEDLLGLREVSVTAGFFEAGGNSLKAARLFGRIESEFGRRLPLATLYKAPTIAALAALLDRPAGEAATLRDVEMHTLQPLGSEPPFFCIPGVGSDVIAFGDLARELGVRRPFYGLQLRGLEGSEVSGPASTIEEAASGFVQAIRRVQPEGPYFVGGHCFGSLLAWEIARQLEAAGARVGLLALLDPVVSNSFQSEVVARGRLLYSLQKFLRLGVAGKGRYVLEKLLNIRRAILIRQRLGRSIERARVMHQHYRIGAFGGEVLVFLAEDSFLNIDPGRDPRRYYERQAVGTRYVSVPGNHDTILHDPGVRVLAAGLRDGLFDPP